VQLLAIAYCLSCSSSILFLTDASKTRAIVVMTRLDESLYPVWNRYLPPFSCARHLLSSRCLACTLRLPGCTRLVKLPTSALGASPSSLPVGVEDFPSVSLAELPIPCVRSPKFRHRRPSRAMTMPSPPPPHVVVCSLPSTSTKLHRRCPTSLLCVDKR
jgi:hypothetical protein